MHLLGACATAHAQCADPLPPLLPCRRAQLYEPFYADFGPLNLGKTHRFCETTKQLLQVRVCRAAGHTRPRPLNNLGGCSRGRVCCHRAHAAAVLHAPVPQDAQQRGKKLYLYTGPQPQAKANTAVLVRVALRHFCPAAGLLCCRGVA